MCNVGDCDAVALAAIDTQGESEFCVPSGPVNQAEIPPVSVAGVDRSRYKGTWYKAMETEMQELVDSNTFTVLDKLPEGEKAIGV